MLGNTFCRKFVSSLLGDGGVGKTAVRHVQAVSLASGRSLSGEHIFKRARVLIISLEDDIDELRRRIWAIRLHYGVAAAELDGWLFLCAPGKEAGKLMITDHRGRLVIGELFAKLEHVVVARHLDLLILDPLVKTHSVPENVNDAMDAVIGLLTTLGVKYDIAVDVPHHTSKGASEPGDASRGRGASATVDAGRLVYTATPMSRDEAKAFGVPPDDRWDYIRIDRAKVNITRKSGAAKWFRLVGVPLNNVTELVSQR